MASRAPELAARDEGDARQPLRFRAQRVDTERYEAIRLTELGRLVVDAQREREGRAKAFLSVPLFRAVFDKFKGGVLPPPAALEKELVSLGVASTLKDMARRVLERSAEQAGYYDHGRERLVMPGVAPPGDHQSTGASEKGGGISGSGGGGGTGLNLDPLLIELLRKIPSKEEGWAPSRRVRWFRTFAMNVSQIYDGDDEPVELEIEIAKRDE
jgi:hypothetical protein